MTTACRSCAGPTTGATSPGPARPDRLAGALTEEVPPSITDWAEDDIGCTVTFYRLPRLQHKYLPITARSHSLTDTTRIH